MTTTKGTESVERVIPAPPAAIFALLADAARHQEIDGSGTVKGTKPGAEPLTLGSTFGMSMRIGLPYSTSNSVIEFEPDRRIAWQTKANGILGKLVGGRIWRYELEPTDGGTLVRETWDISQERNKRVVESMRPKTIISMSKTLARIESLVTAG